MSDWLRHRRDLLGREGGYMMVVAMILIVIGIAAGAAAMTEALSARGHANRTQRSERALQAADAGVQTEVYRANQVNLGGLKLTSGLSLSGIIDQLLTCPIPQVNASGQVVGLQFTAIASVGRPCPVNAGSGITNPGPNQEPVGDHAYFETQFVPGTTSVGDFVQFNPKIVASGVDDNGASSSSNQYVSRRVEAILAPVMPWRTLEAANNLEIDVPAAAGVAGVTTFNGTAAAGGNFTLKGQGLFGGSLVGANVNGSSGLGPAAIDYCGSKTVTAMTLTLYLGNITKISSCSGLVNRPTVSLSPTKAACVPTAGPETCSTDAGFGTSYIGGAQDEIYNPTSTKTISFGPGDYVFCSFHSAGPVNLNPTSTQAVRIFIDSPSTSRCSGFAGHNGITGGSFTANKGVGNLLAATHPSQGQIYVVGNGTNDGTSVTMTGSGLSLGQSAFVYAPSSNVTVDSSTLGTGLGALAGAFVGYDVTVSASTISQDLGLLNYPLSNVLGPFYVKQYIECAPQYPLPSPDPTSGC
jgi:hypothetical protein